MNEIEKLYENVAIECNLPCQKRGVECINNLYCNPFTAEKQLELIKWLARKSHITIGKGLPWGQYDDDWWTVTSKKGYVGTNAHKLEEALANFVNCLWQDLTDAEKVQIKEILNG